MAEDRIRITALLPVKEYDPEFLRAAIGSMLEQTSPRWRLIVICEPGRERHFRALLAAELADPRISVIGNEGEGLAGALNSGLRAAETEFCAILLGDDMWSPRAVEVLERRIAAEGSVDFFHSARVTVDERGRALSAPWQGSENVRPQDFLRAAPLKHLLCFRRSTALEIGGLDESFRLVGPDDYDFPWSMAEHGASFRLVPEVLYYYREHRRFRRLSADSDIRDRWREISRMWHKHGAGGIRGRLRALRAGRFALRKGL